MDYLWREYSPQEYYKVDPFTLSTPLEIDWRTGDAVKVNPLLRFADIFSPLLRSRELWEDDRQKKKLLELSNCLLHSLARLDRLCGMSVDLLREEQLERELLQGCFGESAGELFSRLAPERKQLIVQYLSRQEMAGGRRLYFREAVKAVFPQAGIYFYQPDEIFLLYLPQRENDADRACLKLLGMLFLDITAKRQEYWQYPFAVMGRKPTMRLNRMRLYGERKEA